MTIFRVRPFRNPLDFPLAGRSSADAQPLSCPRTGTRLPRILLGSQSPDRQEGSELGDRLERVRGVAVNLQGKVGQETTARAIERAFTCDLRRARFARARATPSAGLRCRLGDG